MKTTGLVLLGLLLAIGVSTAEAEEKSRVDPDRPSVSNSARTVPPGAVQIESGIEYARTSMGGARTERQLSVQATGRAGVAERLELRVEMEPLVHLKGPADETGVGDLVLGAKWEFLEAPEGVRWPSMALLPFVKVPTASAPIGSERTDFGLLLLMSFDLPASIGFDLNAGLVGVAQERPSGYLVQALVSGAFSMEIGEHLSPFVEMFYTGPEERDGLAGLSVGGGVVYRVTRRVAIDGALYASIAGRAPDYMARAGLTVRFGR